MWCLHLLGDRMPGNTRVEWVLSPQGIVNDLEGYFESLFRGHPEYARALGQALRDALKAGHDEFEQSALIMETLQDAPVSDMVLRCWGRTLAKHGITFTENEEDSGRLEMFLDMWANSRAEAGQ